MSDDTTDPRHELASAFLDGELDVAERARVEASPEVLDLVATFGAVRATIADAPPAPADARDSAIAAALAEFDLAAAPVAAAAAVQHQPAAKVVHLGARRTWQWRILSGAAAAAVVVLVGMVVLSPGSSDDEASLTKATDAARSFDASADAPAAAPEAAGTESRPTIAEISGAADAVLLVNTPSELLALAAPEPAVTAPPGSGGGTTPLPAQTTPIERADPSTAMLDSPCAATGQVVVAQVVYIDTPAIVVRDTSTGVVQALDASTCAVLVEVTP